ncbi:IclR family transcriptional regulator [Rhodococcus koreensis]
MRPTRHARPAYAITAVDNALKVLHLLRDEGSVRISEVAEKLQIAPSSAHRLMAMLVYQGFALRDDSRVYFAGPALRAPVIETGDTKTLIDAARPILNRLCDELGETVNLASRVGVHTRVLTSIEANSALRIGDRSGSVVPAHIAAAGRALLAVEPPALIERLYRGSNSDSSHEQLSDDDYRELLAELALTRRRGFALCREEGQIGVAALAVPIISPAGRPLTTITVSTPASRLKSLYSTPQRMERIVAAQCDLTNALGEVKSPVASHPPLPER